ncbi:SH3 domain signaling protein [Arthroderma uncinatum]|uniref:SH3 domain signaling protein n=1 Tax=Arthroderma uncinatum TaxID=74035 RepID=UPI00144AA4B3|nr:SH3 domain signaling protein [Arthroderma uncinatum]KAF3482499.1 SH3 domain signaling protein [Arthroderma uncinatum]
MLNINRQFGKFMKRSADESQVSVLLKDFDDADKLLQKIIESSKAWRDAWSAIFTYQARLVLEFEQLYNPIIGASEPSADHTPAEVPEHTLHRVVRLREEYDSLKADLVAELDFERYQSRVDSGRKKTKRSDRDNAALSKAEMDLTKATDDYNAADDHLRSILPGLITATFSILPHLLGAQIEIQNTLLALYYTTLHTYCEEQQLPSPPPPMEDIIRTFDENFINVQREIETFNCVAGGKTARQPRTSGDHKNGNHTLSNGRAVIGAGSSSRKPSTSPKSISRLPSTPSLDAKPRINRYASSSQLDAPAPDQHHSPASTHHSPASTHEFLNNTLHHVASAPTAPHNSPHFIPPIPTATKPAQATATSAMAGVASLAAAAAAKKKPPPPPPPRTPSASQIQFVTALYDFGGQGAGDLVFKEGDRIRVIKKTDSTDDWWQGELRGVRGSFPANYCS